MSVELEVFKKINKMESVSNINIGDQIVINLKSLGEYTATVQQVNFDEVVLMFDDCLLDMPMNKVSTNIGGFKKSNLNKWLKKDFKKMLPENILNCLKDISLPSYGNIFGHDNHYDKYFEPDNDEQFILMKKRKNRIGFLKDEFDWYWLKNPTNQSVSSTCVAFVNYCGFARYASASGSYGVRPILYLVRE